MQLTLENIARLAQTVAAVATTAACLNDAKAAAKMELDKLISRVGEARVRSVLSANEKAK